MAPLDHLTGVGLAVLLYLLLFWLARLAFARVLGRRERDVEGSPTPPSSHLRASVRDPGEPIQRSPGTCPRCGTENDPDYTYCRSCVAAL